jgi:prolyl-tRNA synthetase
VNDQNKETVLAEAKKISERLGQRFRTKLDDRDHLTPGRKFNEWELKGVPVRVEVGPRDIASGQAVLVRRDTGAKRPAKLSSLEEEVTKDFEEMHRSLFERARNFLASNTHMTSSYAELKRIIETKGGIVRSPWCGSAECEARVREETGAKIVNIPLDQHKVKTSCVVCGKDAQTVANFARSY